MTNEIIRNLIEILLAADTDQSDGGSYYEGPVGNHRHCLSEQTRSDLCKLLDSIPVEVE